MGRLNLHLKHNGSKAPQYFQNFLTNYLLFKFICKPCPFPWKEIDIKEYEGNNITV